ncbi:efflux RND transporter periplasmic adaptor subunit [bacterium]|nr:efflux RND transporter periplasmic adaptor subunit [bacterium]
MSTMKPKSGLKKKLIAFAIIVGGLAIMFLLIASKKQPERQQTEFSGVLVQVIQVSPESQHVKIVSHGTVRPRQQVNIVPQISGKVEWVHPEFMSGGIFYEGEALLRIETIDYELAVQQAKATVAQAEYGLAMAEANAEIALEEWELMKNTRAMTNGSEEQKPGALLLHEPQLRQAKANLQSAKAQFDRANLNLSRTIIKAPFNCRVKNESVSPGQMVSVSAPIANIYSTDMVEIEVGLPVADLPWINIPGADATVLLETSTGESYTWKGKVERDVGAIDEMGRLGKIVVTVEDPFKIEDEDSPSLNVGTFVEVHILGREVRDVFAIPRHALRHGDIVWVARPDNTLEVRKVTVKRKTQEEVLISNGLKQGDNVILTSLNGAADGLKLRLMAESNGSEVTE